MAITPKTTSHSVMLSKSWSTRCSAEVARAESAQRTEHAQQECDEEDNEIEELQNRAVFWHAQSVM